VEDYPGSGSGSGYSSGGCFMGFSSRHYTSNHNPFVYYQDILNNTSRCSRITPANSKFPTQTACGTPLAVETDDFFLGELSNAASAVNYLFLTPNSIDDLHDDCTNGDVSLGNQYLQLLVPKILNSTLFRTTRAALFVTFDEVAPFVGVAPNNAPYMYTVWASHSSSTTRSAYKSTQHYNHFSALKTVEDNWGFLYLTPSDATATNMSEFLL